MYAKLKQFINLFTHILEFLIDFRVSTGKLQIQSYTEQTLISMFFLFDGNKIKMLQMIWMGKKMHFNY